MTVRPLRVGTGGDSRLGLTISIETVFLAVLCLALVQQFHFRRGDNAKSTKRKYGGSN